MSADSVGIPRALLVASAGGHLTQLVELSDRFDPPLRMRTWVTSDGPQVSTLVGDRVILVPPVHPRDLRGLARASVHARRILRGEPFDVVISTGAGIALAFLPLAAAKRIPSIYIESATRSLGPSLTGRLLSRWPGVRLYTQHRTWASASWQWAGSVFDGFQPAERPRTASPPRVLVTVGTQEPYGFRRLIERLVALIPPGWDVTWQTGSTPVGDLGIEGRKAIPGAEMRAIMASCDLVVAHAGTGSALAALSVGQCPVLVPREVEHGEHVDAHQFQTARYLESLGLAVAASVDELSLDLLERAARTRIERRDPPPFPLWLGER